MLKEEAARIAENVTLSQNEKNKINSARYSAMMAPIVMGRSYLHLKRKESRE